MKLEKIVPSSAGSIPIPVSATEKRTTPACAHARVSRR